MSLSEADTRAKLIDPIFHRRGGQKTSFVVRRLLVRAGLKL